MQVQKRGNKTGEESIHQQTLVNLVRTYHWFNHKLKEDLLAYDITVQQFYVLSILCKLHPLPCTVNDIKSKMPDKMSDASRIVERLIQKELVKKTHSLSDKRVADVQLRPEGLKLLRKIKQHHHLVNERTANLTDAEAEQLNILLNKLRG